MDCAGVYPEGPGRNVRVFERLGVDKEHGGRGVSHQHTVAVL